ncbi:unnamed protein product [Symbiodinium sp. KB8]|nr:unnamed protein product [Symbiodinium sp. KB8]
MLSTGRPVWIVKATPPPDAQAPFCFEDFEQGTCITVSLENHEEKAEVTRARARPALAEATAPDDMLLSSLDLTDHNWFIKEDGGGGDCAFKAVARAIAHRKGLDPNPEELQREAATLRLLAVGHLAKHKQRFSEFWVAEDPAIDPAAVDEPQFWGGHSPPTTFDDFIKMMARKEAYADGVALQALSERLGTPSIVWHYQPEDSAWQRSVLAPFEREGCAGTARKSPPAVTLVLRDAHYRSLLGPPSADCPSAWLKLTAPRIGKGAKLQDAFSLPSRTPSRLKAAPRPSQVSLEPSVWWKCDIPGCGHVVYKKPGVAGHSQYRKDHLRNVHGISNPPSLRGGNELSSRPQRLDKQMKPYDRRWETQCNALVRRGWWAGAHQFTSSGPDAWRAYKRKGTTCWRPLHKCVACNREARKVRQACAKESKDAVAKEVLSVAHQQKAQFVALQVFGMKESWVIHCGYRRPSMDDSDLLLELSASISVQSLKSPPAWCLTPVRAMLDERNVSCVDFFAVWRKSLLRWVKTKVAPQWLLELKTHQTGNRCAGQTVTQAVGQVCGERRALAVRGIRSLGLVTRVPEAIAAAIQAPLQELGWSDKTARARALHELRTIWRLKLAQEWFGSDGNYATVDGWGLSVMMGAMGSPAVDFRPAAQLAARLGWSPDASVSEVVAMSQQLGQIRSREVARRGRLQGWIRCATAST